MSRSESRGWDLLRVRRERKSSESVRSRQERQQRKLRVLLEGSGGEVCFFTRAELAGSRSLRVVRADLRFGRDWREEISDSTL